MAHALDLSVAVVGGDQTSAEVKYTMTIVSVGAIAIGGNYPSPVQVNANTVRANDSLGGPREWSNVGGLPVKIVEPLLLLGRNTGGGPYDGRFSYRQNGVPSDASMTGVLFHGVVTTDKKGPFNAANGFAQMLAAYNVLYGEYLGTFDISATGLGGAPTRMGPYTLNFTDTLPVVGGMVDFRNRFIIGGNASTHASNSNAKLLMDYDIARYVPPLYIPMSLRNSGLWKSLDLNRGFIRRRVGGIWVDFGVEQRSTVMQANKGHNRIRQGGSWLQLPPMT